MVAARETHVAMSEAFLEKREASLCTCDELLWKSEMQFRAMQWDLEVKAKDDSDDLWN